MGLCGFVFKSMISDPGSVKSCVPLPGLPDTSSPRDPNVYDAEMLMVCTSYGLVEME